MRDVIPSAPARDVADGAHGKPEPRRDFPAHRALRPQFHDFAHQRIGQHGMLAGLAAKRLCLGQISERRFSPLRRGRIVFALCLAALWMCVRPVSVASGLATLSEHVVGVIGGRSSKQVVGANAFSVVAAMANQEPVRKRAVVQLPGKPVDVKASGVARAATDNAIPVVLHGPRPLPAAVCFLNAGPKSVCDWSGHALRLARGISGSHGAARNQSRGA